MQFRTALLPAMIFLVALVWPGHPPLAQVTNQETPGNLVSATSLGCIGMDKVVNTETPADLYPAVSVCLKQSDYAKAVDLFATAGIYARFDTLRVADQTAHDAKTVLVVQAMSSASGVQKSRFNEVLTATTKDPAQLAALCGRIRQLGPPNYMPTYMIRHGMSMFTEQPTRPLVEHFDARAAWQKSLRDYLQCPDA